MHATSGAFLPLTTDFDDIAAAQSLAHCCSVEPLTTFDCDVLFCNYQLIMMSKAYIIVVMA